MIENRKVERFNLNLETYVFVGDHASAKKPQNLVTRDVSANGAYLFTDEPLPVGTKVKVDVVLSMEAQKSQAAHKAIIKASGSVLRTDREGMAIGFDERSRFMPFAEEKLEIWKLKSSV